MSEWVGTKIQYSAQFFKVTGIQMKYSICYDIRKKWQLLRAYFDCRSDIELKQYYAVNLQKIFKIQILWDLSLNIRLRNITVGKEELWCQSFPYP